MNYPYSSRLPPCRLQCAGNVRNLLLRLIIGLLAYPAAAQEPLSLNDLLSMSIEELSKTQITSVAKRDESLAEAPASIYVITGADIRRAGAANLPDALRLAPNLHVARASASQYAISARGFNNALGNQLLVLIDGRTVYTPLFSGVFWDAQDLVMQDIERIEVISGPGAALWGANAVNGVINIITRSASDTQGGLLAANASAHTAGSERDGAIRYGGEIGSGHYRVYGKKMQLDNTERENGSDIADEFSRGQIGFRADWGSKQHGVTVQGDAYEGKSEQNAPGQTTISGENLLARWSNTFADHSSIHVQGYYDHTTRDNPGAFRDDMNIYDFEFQHALAPLGSHNILWGGGYRFARDEVDNSVSLAFLPAEKNLKWANIFLQDEISLRKDLKLTLGGKSESNVYTGGEFLPNARLAWKVADDHLLWAEVSRAVREPARIDRDFYLRVLPGPGPYQIVGGPDFESEVERVIEIGYRAQPTDSLSYSITAFRHARDKLRSGTVTSAGATVVNQIAGVTSGVEAWANYQVTHNWRLSGGLVELRQRLWLKAGALDPTGPSALGNDPKHTWTLRSLLDISERHRFDVTVRHVGELPDPAVPAYTAVDARLGWQPRRDLQLAISGQNLFDPGHTEFGNPLTASEYKRTVSVSAQWQW